MTGSVLEPLLLRLEGDLAQAERWISDIRTQNARQTGPLAPEHVRERNPGLVSRAATGTLAISVDGDSVTLGDVPLSSWFAPYVRSAAERGMISGYRDAAGKPTGIFAPADAVTVGELAKLAVHAGNVTIATCPRTPKNRLAQEVWFSSVIACAEEKRWTVYSDATVEPRRPATRAEVVVTLLQALGKTAEPLSGMSGPFLDVTPATQFASFVAKAKRDGIVAGFTSADGAPTGMFGPTEAVNRAEAAKIAVRASDAYAK